jgi:hypothetical protein
MACLLHFFLLGISVRKEAWDCELLLARQY